MRMVFAALALTAVIVPGVAHGVWTNRWSFSDEPEASAARLPSVPMKVDTWEAQDMECRHPPDIAGVLARRYVNANTGQEVLVFLTTGKPGPVSVHSPDVCLPAGNYTMVSSPARVKVKTEGSPAAEFLSCTFERSKATGTQSFRVFWSWSAGEVWQAPRSPRWTFGGLPVLHKFYAIQPLSADAENHEKEADSCLDFVKLFIPELETSLFHRP